MNINNQKPSDFLKFNVSIAKQYMANGDACFQNKDYENAILNYSKIIEMEDEPELGFNELEYQALMKRGEAKKILKDKKGSNIDFLVAKLESTKTGGPNSPFNSDL
jgi:tetratricopeptide (TPR) repeat protein